MYFIVPNFLPIGQIVSEIWPYFDFQDGGRPSSWICYTRVWTTHEEYLLEFVSVQNLSGFGAVVSTI